MIGHPFIELQSVDSTNNYAMAQVHAGLAFHGTTYFSYEQLNGRGQRGKSWVTKPGENITMSILLEPDFLRPMQQFILSASIARGSYDFLIKYFPDDWYIKWPNDLYWRDRKAGGILIESICKGDKWLFAVVGMGININQTRFPADISRAISLKQITGKTYEVKKLAMELCNSIGTIYEQLRNEDYDKIIESYNECLYKRNELVRLKKGNIIFETTIKEVTAQGQLITVNGMERSFDLSEIEWVFDE
ncbi:MAG TPA: biotin--[acetyl-CoA-carboxylase] ligase [Puia sp.]|nr:biotin--[acetyl-CoA-carboxylase] ligase [Puia sp.]